MEHIWEESGNNCLISPIVVPISAMDSSMRRWIKITFGTGKITMEVKKARNVVYGFMN